VPEIIAALRARVGSPNCGAALSAQALDDIIDALLSNPAYGGRSDARAHLIYERALLRLDTGYPADALPLFEASFALNPDPQVMVNRAQILLNLNRPAEALQALDAANQAPLPWFKRWLDATGGQQARLRVAAEAMLRQNAVNQQPQP